MLSRMDAHAMLGQIAQYSYVVGDGGPRGYRRRGKELPEKYLPGRLFAQQDPEVRAALVRAVDPQTPQPAAWFLRSVIDEGEPHALLPAPPVDRRRWTHGRLGAP